jgi:hypothetical protein
MEATMTNNETLERIVTPPSTEGLDSKPRNGDGLEPGRATGQRAWVMEVLLLGALSAAAGVAALAGSAPTPLGFKPLTLQAFTSEIGWLVAVALILERAVEVIVMVFRDQQADLLDETESQATEALKSAEAFAAAVAVDAAATPAAKAQAAETAARGRLALAAARRRTIIYRAGTKMLALRVGFAFGVLMSLAGVRALNGLLPDNTAPAALFTVVDVLITGAMLAGGSEGIHRMANVFTGFMDNLATRADQSKSQVRAPVG